MDEMDSLLNLLDQRPRENWPWNSEPAAEGENAVNPVAQCSASLLAYSRNSPRKQRSLHPLGYRSAELPLCRKEDHFRLVP